MDNEKLEKLKFYGDKYWSLINEKNKSIISVIQLLVALLVIASFNDKIIPLDSLIYLKILILFLLTLIPIMLVDYLLQINDGLKALHQELEFPSPRKQWHIKLLDGSNYVYALITIIVIDVIIQLINQNLKISLPIFIIQFLIILTIIISKRKKENS